MPACVQANIVTNLYCTDSFIMLSAFTVDNDLRNRLRSQQTRMKLLQTDFPFPCYRQETEARIRKSYTQNCRPTFVRHNATRRARVIRYRAAQFHTDRKKNPRFTHAWMRARVGTRSLYQLPAARVSKIENRHLTVK